MSFVFAQSLPLVRKFCKNNSYLSNYNVFFDKDNLGIVFASATVGVYLVAQNIKVAIIKKYYNKVWGKNRVLKGAHSIYYLFNITKGGNKLNGWYAYNYKSGGVKKL